MHNEARLKINGRKWRVRLVKASELPRNRFGDCDHPPGPHPTIRVRHDRHGGCSRSCAFLFRVATEAATIVQAMSEQTEVKIGKQVSLQTLMQGVQTIVLLGSIAGAFLMVGRRDAAIDNQAERMKELAAITADLARTVSTLSATDREYAARIDSIQSRIDRLERKP